MLDGRINLYWVLSLTVPALLMLPVAASRRGRALTVAALLSVVSTYALANLAVWKKWEIRHQTARTEAEVERATADGANKVFTAYVVAPAEAALSTAFWGWLGWQLGHRLRRRSSAEGR